MTERECDRLLLDMDSWKIHDRKVFGGYGEERKRREPPTCYGRWLSLFIGKCRFNRQVLP